MSLFFLPPAAIRNKMMAIVRADHVSVIFYGILYARNLVYAHGARRPMTTRPSCSAKLQRLFHLCCPFRALAPVKRTTKEFKCGEITPIHRNIFCLKSLRLNSKSRATSSYESLSAAIMMKVVKSGQFQVERLCLRMLLTLCMHLIVGQAHQAKGRFVINSKRWFPLFGLRETQSMKKVRAKDITFYTCECPRRTTRRRY